MGTVFSTAATRSRRASRASSSNVAFDGIPHGVLAAQGHTPTTEAPAPTQRHALTAEAPARTSLVVCGHDVLAESLPGLTLVLDLRSPGAWALEQQLRNEAVSALSLPSRYAALAVAQSVWERDVSMHGTTQSETGTCARIPLALTVPASANELASTERFAVRAKPYNPLMHIGGGQVLPLSTSGGLDSPLHGLALYAHNLAGVIAAVSWVGSSHGEATVGVKSFELHSVQADTAEDTTPDGAAEEVASLEGCCVRSLVDAEQVCTCLTHLTSDGRVRLRRPDGSCVWRATEEVALVEQTDGAPSDEPSHSSIDGSGSSSSSHGSSAPRSDAPAWDPDTNPGKGCWRRCASWRLPHGTKRCNECHCKWMAFHGRPVAPAGPVVP
uniref:Uncharacterized protein n=1 Tax=Prymnesium polylepis TaxID=72548 RepID=A0A7S4MFC8_9EUKA